MTTLITGATRGIGRGLFNAAARAGENPVGTYRGARPPVDAPAGGEWLPLDLADPRAPAALAGRLRGRPLELLVCNAGIYPDKGQPLTDGFPSAMWAEVFAVNVAGVFLTIQALLSNLHAAPAARIAIIGSIMGSQELAPGGSYIYRASKAAVLNLGRNLAADLRGAGIAVGVYHPGWVRTEMGGSSADIDLDEAVAGLRERFAVLDMARSGCFEAWDGRALPM